MTDTTAHSRDPQPEGLPVIDLERFDFDEAAAERIAGKLDRSFREIGFCYIANTGITPDLVDGVFTASRRFHAQDQDAKDAIAINRFHRGYIATKTSLLTTSSVAKVTKPNLSESFMVMHEVTPEDTAWGQPLQGPNQWPADLPGFREAVTSYNAALEGVARRLTRLIACALRLAPDALDPYFERPTTWLRLLHYPPQRPEAAADEFGAAPHTDYGFLTILAQDVVGGLEVRRSDGTWLAATPVPGAFVVNVGDMLSRWTNARWQSTPHRVQNRAQLDRYSVPYFFDPATSATIACLPTCLTPGEHPRYEPVRYGEYVVECLNRNYSYRNAAGTGASAA
ncbi:MAG TPA: 2-oxoglutarate and iron-dependent oxygenase domain-containing protein [Stellaceae bacterium]|jgi:isopenicillin N synthase-like dioxygenase